MLLITTWDLSSVLNAMNTAWNEKMAGTERKKLLIEYDLLTKESLDLFLKNKSVELLVCSDNTEEEKKFILNSLGVQEHKDLSANHRSLFYASDFFEVTTPMPWNVIIAHINKDEMDDSEFYSVNISVSEDDAAEKDIEHAPNNNITI